MAPDTLTLNQLLTPGQCKQLAELLSAALQHGDADVSILVRAGQVKFFHITKNYRASRDFPADSPDFYYGEIGHA